MNSTTGVDKQDILIGAESGIALRAMMGMLLDRELGRDYYAMGFAFEKGIFALFDGLTFVRETTRARPSSRTRERFGLSVTWDEQR